MKLRKSFYFQGIAIGLLGFLLNACDDSDSPEDYPTDAESDVGQLADAQSDATLDAADANLDDADIVQDAADATLDAADGFIDVDAFNPHVDSGVEIPPNPYRVVTELAVPATISGLANKVTCLALDEQGDAILGVETLVEVRPGTQGVDFELSIEKEKDENGDEIDCQVSNDKSCNFDLVGITAGEYSVKCKIPSLGLRDVSAQRWDVDPGPVESTRACLFKDDAQPCLETSEVEAGNAVLVVCRANDSEGNPIEASEADVVVMPAGAGAEVSGHYVTFTTAGRYEIFCDMEGARQKESALVDVLPGLPAEIVAGVKPLKAFYSPGEVFALGARVVDSYGNEVPSAQLEWSWSASEAPAALGTFGEGRYLAEDEGYFEVSVSVASRTYQGKTLKASANVLVDSGGPALSCTRPVGMLVGVGEPISLEGSVSDISGLEVFTVDGKQQSLGSDGHFSVEVTPQWGLNVHEIRAVDKVGNVNSLFCSYFASDDYLNENSELSDSVALRLKQGAIDDGAPNSPISSLIDLIREMLNSQGLMSALDTALTAQNPLIPNECQKRVLGVCVFKFGLTYRDLNITGPNSMTAELVEGGLRVKAHIQKLMISLKTMGTLSVGGKFYVNNINLDLTFDVYLRNNRPKVKLRQTNSVTLGDIDFDFDSRVVGWLLDLIGEMFERKIRNLLIKKLTGYLESNIDSVLSDVLSGLDLDGLGQSFTVPGLAGGPSSTLSLGLGFDSLDVTTNQLRIGIHTTVNGPTRLGLSSAGVPLPPERPEPQADYNQTVMATIRLGLVNQLLHRLWRAGVFEFNDLGAQLGEGASLKLSLQLPPAVRGAPESSGAAVELHLGPAVGQLKYPGIFDEAITLTLALKAVAAVSIENGEDGDQLEFSGITIDKLYMYVDGVAMTDEQRQTIESKLKLILQDVLDHYLNNMLPTVPIPDFLLPSSLTSFGIPAGTRIGLRHPQLEAQECRFVVEGEFGE